MTISYKLQFDPRAEKDWRKLDKSVKLRFQKKLEERLAGPRVSADKLRDMPNCYKIKLSSVGYRLIYQVEDDKLVVLVIAIGQRERLKAYRRAADALDRKQ